MNVEDVLYPLLPLQERVPENVRAGIGRVYRRLPQRLRLGAGYDEFRGLAAAAEFWSEEEMVDYQVTQLRAVLRHAAAHSPFYASRFADAGFDPRRFDGPDDLAGCPFTGKEDLVAHREDMATDRPGRSRRLFVTSGGSTGAPVGFYLHRGVSRPKEQAFLEAQWRRAGYFDGARLAVVRGQVTAARAAGRISAYDPIGDRLILSSSHLTEERLPEYLDEIVRFGPEILHIYPSAALLLAALLARAGRTFPIPLRCVLAASERLDDVQRRRLEEVFECRVYSWYGHAERVVLAGQGRRSHLFYFWPAYGFVELGPPDAQGLQEVIGTSFHNLAMPLIRYRTGDLVRAHDPRRDGPKELPWPAVRSIEGRGQELLVTATGRRISLTAVNMHDSTFEGLYAVQFFQETAGRVELRYVAGSDVAGRRHVQIESALRRKLGDDLEVELRRVDDIERTGRGKGKWLVSSLADASPPSLPAADPGGLGIA